MSQYEYDHVNQKCMETLGYPLAWMHSQTEFNKLKASF